MEQRNAIRSERPLHGVEAYLYGLKARAQRHHCMGYGTFSVELDTLERLRRDYCRAVAPITYVPIYVRATALTIERHPEANAILFRRPFGHRIVQFERADVSLPITRAIDGRPVTFIGTIRGAATKSLAEIQQDLVAYQRGPIDQSAAIRRLRRLARLPFWMTQWIHRRLTRSPEFLTRTAGTCGLTLVDGVWGDTLFPVAPTSVMFGIGAARREPVVRDDAIVIRRMLKVCLMVDNYVIPGNLGARLGRCFKELIESGEVMGAETLAGVAR